jgi:hypothetical protein
MGGKRKNVTFRRVVIALVAALSVGCAGEEEGGETETRPAVFTKSEAAGCGRPYTSTSPWNTPIGRSPDYRSDSDSYIERIDGKLTSDPTQYTSPVYEVSRDTRRVTVRLSGRFSEVSLGGKRLEILNTDAVEVPIPDGAEPAEGNDAKIILLDPVTGDEWGLWRLEQNGDGDWEAVNGYHYNVRWSGVPPRDSEDRPFHSRGAGVTYLAGLVRLCEIARGRIDHALGFSYDHPSAEYVYPAAKSDGSGSSSDLPEGARLQLDPELTEREIRDWGCRGPCLTIARALQVYGMYLIDSSGRPKITLEYEGTAGWDGRVHEDTVSPIPIDAFKVLEFPHEPREGE